MNDINIKEQIFTLVKVQELDYQKYKLQLQKDAIPIKIAELEKDHASKMFSLNEAEEIVKTLQVKQKDKELELQSKEESVQKHETQLFQIKNNKEYQAMVKEIGGLKADSSLIEDDILLVMDEIEKAKKVVQQEKNKYDLAAQELNTQKSELNEEMNVIAKQMQELKEKRQTIVGKIDPDLLEQYETILEKKEGRALVEITGTTCGGCNMSLPPQLVNEAMLCKTIVHCGNCFRILYAKPSAKEE